MRLRLLFLGCTLSLAAQEVNRVVNAADYTEAIAPGSIIAIFGDSLAARSGSAVATPFPTFLERTSVEVDGRGIPLFFVSPGQINAQMPFGAGGQVQVRVRTPGGISATVAVPVAPSAPRLFTPSMDGKGNPILVHAADYSFVSAASPAVAGEFLILFLTGLGVVTPAPGSVAVIFGAQAEVSFAGQARGFAGLNQINFQVPGGVPAGAADDSVITATELGSSSNLSVAWPAARPHRLTAVEAIHNTRFTVPGDASTATLSGLKAGTRYTVTVEAGERVGTVAGNLAASGHREHYRRIEPDRQ